MSLPDKVQIDRFKELARALGADEDEEAFRANLRTVAKQRPKRVVESAAENEKAATKR